MILCSCCHCNAGAANTPVPYSKVTTVWTQAFEPPETLHPAHSLLLGLRVHFGSHNYDNPFLVTASNGVLKVE